MEGSTVCVDATGELLERPYQYDTLPGGQYFRYLILQPGSGDDPLECNLRTTRLVDTDYEAISYVWGTEVKQHTILCDGYVLKITKNLYNALRRLRFPVTVRRLWADSICNHQQDAAEKAHQVANMGLIYARARCVLVYMGPDPFHYTPQVSSLLEDMRRSFNRKLAKHGTLTWGVIPFSPWDDPILSDVRWHSLEVFLHLPWFERGWVVREAGLARECLVVWGDRELSWTNLMWVAFWLDGRGITIPSLPSSFRPLRAHMDAYWDRHNDTVRIFFWSTLWSPNRLLDYIALGRRLQFKDRRDGIYAFFDLAIDSANQNQLRLIADYSRSLCEIYHRFAMQYLEMSGDITLLDYISHDPSNVQNELPSWVPTWNPIETDEGTDEASDRVAKPGLLARNGSKRRLGIINDKLLKVHGVVWDSTEFLTESLEPSAITLEFISSLWLRIHSLGDCIAYNAISLAMTLLQTLTINLIFGKVNVWYSCADAFALHLSQVTTPTEGFQRGQDPEHQKKLDYVLKSTRAQMQNKKLMITKRGYMGLAPPTAREGDLCGIIFGCKYPCLLRPPESGSHYQFVGAAFFLSCRVYTADFAEDEMSYAVDDAAERVPCRGDDTDSEVVTHSELPGRARSRRPYWDLFGSAGYEDWMDWDVEEQDIYLC